MFLLAFFFKLQFITSFGKCSQFVVINMNVHICTCMSVCCIPTSTALIKCNEISVTTRRMKIESVHMYERFGGLFYRPTTSAILINQLISIDECALQQFLKNIHLAYLKKCGFAKQPRELLIKYCRFQFFFYFFKHFMDVITIINYASGIELKIIYDFMGNAYCVCQICNTPSRKFQV